jgi:spore coat polysaccharide biosynthesis protein SpsF
MKAGVVAIVQARMGSSRLPGKVLMDIEGQPMLKRVVDRTSRSALVDEVLVATTTAAVDDALVSYCAAQDIHTFRGSEFDVLDRYYQAWLTTEASIVVRITADCPLMDPALVTDTIRALRGEPHAPAITPGPAFDFAATRLPPPWRRSYPIGLDVEACTSAALNRAWSEATEPVQREHVMPYLYDGVHLRNADDGRSTGVSSTGFRIAQLECEEDLGQFRWTVDTPQDLDFVREVYACLGPETTFAWKDVLALVRSRPELLQINAGIRHKTLKDLDQRAPRS